MQEALAEGPCLAAEVYGEAEGHGIKERTLKSAKAEATAARMFSESNADGPTHPK